jgi:uncharacterized protein YuzE
MEGEAGAMSIQFNTKFDEEANALYLTLQDGVVFRTVPLSDSIMIDVNHSDTVLGVEFLNPDEFPTFVRTYFTHPELLQQEVRDHMLA